MSKSIPHLPCSQQTSPPLLSPSSTATPSKSCTPFHLERIRLPQSQRHSKERSNPLHRENGEAHILECHQLGLLVPKIRPASPQNTANKKPKTIIGSMITS